SVAPRVMLRRVTLVIAGTFRSTLRLTCVCMSYDSQSVHRAVHRGMAPKRLHARDFSDRGDGLERDFVETSSRSSFLFVHDLFRKPVSTPDQVRGRLFRDHALEIRVGRMKWERISASPDWIGSSGSTGTGCENTAPSGLAR